MNVFSTHEASDYTILLHDAICLDCMCLTWRSVIVSPLSPVVDRKVVGQEAECGRGEPVRDRPEAEASDGFGGR